MSLPSRRSSAAGGPRQLFSRTHAERVALARQQFFEEGVRPSGLVGEAVLQSWMRCTRAHGDRDRMITFDAVTPSRLHATLNRNRELLDAARAELQSSPCFAVWHARHRATRSCGSASRAAGSA